MIPGTKISAPNDPEPDVWFYSPEYSETRQQLEVRCIDSTQLLTRICRKTRKGGIEGLDNKACLKIAKQRTTLLSPVMVEDIVDPMSMSMAMSMALTHFSLKQKYAQTGL